MKGAIAVFAKTPGLSPLKTRLAKTIGNERAEAFYKLSVAAVTETLGAFHQQSGGRITPCWALAEEQAPALAQWQAFPAMWTGEGDFGTRLHAVSRRLLKDHDFVMLTGTDSPQLSAGDFSKAVEKLEQYPQDCVAGPSLDGGFYLFATHQPVSEAIWKSVSYSRETTLEELSGYLEAEGRKIHRLGHEIDVDESDDLELLKQALQERGETLLPAQKTLLVWLENSL